MTDKPEEHQEFIDYPGFIDEAMRGVVRRALALVAREGLPGNHHFYVSFATDYPGVQISPTLKARYPKEITIVIQFQFWDLDVRDDHFSVMLSFNNIPEKLVVPYKALTAFADPSIKFGLQFHAPAHEPMDFSAENLSMETATEAAFDEVAPPHADNEEPPAGSAEVISLDAFRKK